MPVSPLRDFPCVDEDSDNDCDHSDNFTSVTYRFDVLTRGPGGTNVDSCEGQGLNSVRTFSPAFYDPRRTLGPIPLRIDRSCENGPYTLLLTVTYIDNADQSHTLTDTVDFVVGDPQPPNPNPNPKSDPPPSDPPQPQGPAAITQPRTLRARSGPGTEYDVVAVLPKGTWAKIVDIDPQAEWLQIEVVGLDEPVWVERDLTKVAGGSPVSISGTLPGDGPSSSPALASQP